jgi:hypothetical protein
LQVLALRFFKPELDLPFAEQSAIDHLIRDELLAPSVVQCPQRWFNAYQPRFGTDGLEDWQARRGDMLMHFPGGVEREKRMREFLGKAERGEWEMDPSSTLYPKEVSEFWEKKREERVKARKEAEALRKEISTVLENLDVKTHEIGDKLTRKEGEELRNRLRKTMDVMRGGKTKDNKMVLKKAFERLKKVSPAVVYPWKGT